MIRVENLIFEYPGKRALDNVSFEIEKGGVTALVGPNGAGKSTLMRSIAAIDDPFSGTIYVNGVDTREDPRKVHRSIGYLSDFFGLYDDLTVRQSLTYFARAHLIPEKDIQSKIDLAVERLSLTDYYQTTAGELSRGWRQRLGIAQAIIHEPEILLLDEPASGLDPEARNNLSELFLSLQKQGMTLMVSSHILAELEDYCTDMLLLRDGSIISHNAAKTAEASGDGKQLIIQLLEPAEKYVPQISSMENISETSSQGETIRCTFKGQDTDRNSLLKSLMDQNIPVISFTAEEKTLQDIYLDITREGAAGK